MVGGGELEPELELGQSSGSHDQESSDFGYLQYDPGQTL
jgi:hypothetical protein